MARSLSIASLIWGLGLLLSRVIGMVREIVIGRVLGSGAAADVYWTAFVVPDFLNYLLAGGALSLVFIPLFHQHLARGEQDQAWESFSVIANFLLLALGVLTAVLFVLTPQLAPLVAPGFDEAQLAQLTYLIRIILPAQIFHLVGGLLSAVLQARDRHALPAMAPLLYSLSIVVLGLALGPSLGAEGFAWGVLVGSILGPFALPLIGCLREGLRWRPVFSLRHPDFRRYVVLMLPIMVGQSIVVVDDWFFKIYGSLVGTGTVSLLQYAKTLMRVPMGVFGLATAAAAFPTLSRLCAEGQRGQAWDTLIRATRLMLVLACASQAALTAAGTDVATLIYGQGRFSASDLAEIGLYTGVLCLSLWAWSAQNLISRGFYAMQNTWMPTLTGTVVMLLSWPMYRLAAERWGGLGLAVASSCAITVYTAVLTVQLRRAMVPGELSRLSLLGTAAKLFTAALLASGVGLWVSHSLGPLHPVLRAGVSASLAGGMTLALAHAAGVGEVGEIVQRIVGAVRRRLKR